MQSNVCSRDFVINHKFAMETGKIPGPSDTLNLCFLKIVFNFYTKDMGRDRARN